MAVTYLENPRRFPRVPARLRVVVSSWDGGFPAQTEDLGPGGCALVSTRALAQGAALRLAIQGDVIGDRLAVVGRVAWARSDASPRAGVAFEPRQPGAADPRAWFDRFLSSQPGMASRLRRAPDRLYLDAPLYLLPPPRFIIDLSPDEADLLGRLDNGVTPRRLLECPPERRPATLRAIFSLFEKRALTLALGQSAPAWQWREALARLEEEGLVDALVEELDGPAPTPAPGRAPSAFDAVRDQPRGVDIPRPATPPLLERQRATPLPGTIPTVQVAPLGAQRSAPFPGMVPPAAAAAGPSAVGPDTGHGSRPPEAQACLDRARNAAAVGDVQTAISLLRLAIQKSPRDQEIAELLGQLAFRGRRP